MAQRCGDLVYLVGDDLGLDWVFGLGYAGFDEEAGDFRAGEVGLLALETAVADGQDCGSDVDLEAVCHLTSVLERLG